VVANLVANDIARMDLGFINQDFLETDGVDFGFTWDIPAGANDFRVSLQGTKTLSYDLSTEGQVFDGLGSYNRTSLGAPTPEYMANVRLDWSRGNHFARLTVRHVPKLEEDQPMNVDTEEISFTTANLLYNYKFGDGGSVSVGVLNVTDEEDPISDGNITTVNTLTYDPRGRMFSVSVKKVF
jgi:outer membrane receptor protein involved in Fe transport